MYNAGAYTFSANDGLNFAVGMTAYDNQAENILDPSIGEIQFLAYEWGLDANGVPTI